MVLRNREMHARNDDDDAPVPCGATPNLAQLGESYLFMFIFGVLLKTVHESLRH